VDNVQVLVQLAKLADAELMPTVLELAADSLKAACLQDAVAVIKTAPEKVSNSFRLITVQPGVLILYK
jgi:hypothetical protein